ncbi:MAG: class I SAM-dependent methyltransferase [Neisseria sp.]|nr:class I SAM-dependent methyltransferase [Neisseria sp.]
MNPIEHLNQSASKAHAQPEEILAAINLQAGESILEIGIGGGWYAERFAQAVGANGHYHGMDVNPEFVAHIKTLSATYPHMDAEVVAAGELPQTELRFDRIFSRNTYHHLHERSRWFAQMRRFLKEKGELLLIDFNQAHGSHNQPHHYTLEKTLLEEMQAAGFVLKRQHDFLYRQLFMVFQ